MSEIRIPFTQIGAVAVYPSRICDDLTEGLELKERVRGHWKLKLENVIDKKYLLVTDSSKTIKDVFKIKGVVVAGGLMRFTTLQDQIEDRVEFDIEDAEVEVRNFLIGKPLYGVSGDEFGRKEARFNGWYGVPDTYARTEDQEIKSLKA